MLENFIYAKDKYAFKKELEAGNILDEAIVFIEDTKEIWNHGTYFSFQNTDTLPNVTESNSGFMTPELFNKLDSINVGFCNSRNSGDSKYVYPDDNFKLQPGALLIVSFRYDNTSTNPSFVFPNHGYSSVPIQLEGNPITESTLLFAGQSGSTKVYMYDGTYFQYQSGLAYESMTQAIAIAGSNTENMLISAKVLNDIITHRISDLPTIKTTTNSLVTKVNALSKYHEWSILEPKPITFNIDGTTYNGESGMTWEEWLTSEYNTLENGYNIRENGYIDIGNDYKYEFDDLRCLIMVDNTIQLSTDIVKDNVAYWASTPIDPIEFKLLIPYIDEDGWFSQFNGEFIETVEITQRGSTWGDWATQQAHLIGEGCANTTAMVMSDGTIASEFAPGCLGGQAEGVWIQKNGVNVRASQLIEEGETYVVEPIGYLGGGVR